MNVKAVEMLVTPGKHDLQERMQVREGHLAPDKHPTPDERTNAPEDDAELVDAEWCNSCRHTLRVAQRIVPLKGFPRYLALSYIVERRGHLQVCGRCRGRGLYGLMACLTTASSHGQWQPTHSSATWIICLKDENRCHQDVSLMSLLAS
jgi:hypothetical protein